MHILFCHWTILALPEGKLWTVGVFAQETKTRDMEAFSSLLFCHHLLCFLPSFFPTPPHLSFRCSWHFNRFWSLPGDLTIFCTVLVTIHLDEKKGGRKKARKGFSFYCPFSSGSENVSLSISFRLVLLAERTPLPIIGWVSLSPSYPCEVSK